MRFLRSSARQGGEEGPGHEARVQLGRYRRVFESSLDAIVVVDGHGSVTGFNRAAEEMFGCAKADAMGTDIAQIAIPPRHRTKHKEGLARLVRTGESAITRRRVRVDGMRADGSEFQAELVVVPIDETPPRFAAFVRDLSEQDRRERAIAQLARDNEQILSSAGDAILRLDAEGRITYANPATYEMLGLEPDGVVGSVAHELHHHSREDGTPYPRSECPVQRTLREGTVEHHADEVFWRADGTSFPVDYTSAPIRVDGEIVGGVLVFADITAQRERERELRERAEWSERIARALSQDRFELHSQPICDVASREPVMHELLVRMRAPEGELVPPAGFLPQAERFGLITDIDRWVVRQAVRLARTTPVSVNLSAQSVSDPVFGPWVEGRIRAAGCPPGNILFEITESSALQDMEAAAELVGRLVRLGCAFALDDFGTGWGSFAELSTLTLAYLKIDRSFVSGLAGDRASRRAVAAMLATAREFDLRTVAEGVEDEDALRELAELGVDLAQGYLLARPAPLDDPGLDEPGA